MTKAIPIASILIATLAVGRTAVASCLPFRIAFADNYVDEDVYRGEASDISGFRLGLFEAVNHDAYGISVSVVSDGGFSRDGDSRQFVDNDFGGLKLGGLCASFSGSGMGFQLAGLWNIGGYMAGFQIADISSQAAFMRGFQTAGLYTFADMGMFGVQIGGLVAEVGAEGTDEVPAGGVQIGAINISGTSQGGDLRGFPVVNWGF